MYESKIIYRSDNLDRLYEIIKQSILTRGEQAILQYGIYFGSNTKKIEDKLHRVYMLVLDWKEYWEDV